MWEMKCRFGFNRILVSVLGFVILMFGGVVWGQTYYVQPGDSLYTIASRYGTTVSVLQQYNGLRSTAVYPGQAIRITWPTPSSGSVYTVRPGDSLFLISKRYGISVASLQQANNLSGQYLEVGQRLVIPVASGNSSGSSTSYVVKNGDTLYLIAQRFGIPLNSLLSVNRLNNSSHIYPGQRLVIPKAPSTGSGGSYGSFNLSQSDMDLLARLVAAESAGEPLEGQVAVAATILNRLKDPRYPKTLSGIVYQIDNGRYQYSPVLDGRINTPADSKTIQAVQMALNGWDPSNGANGFYNPAKTTNQWVRSQPVTASIGNHVFFCY